MFPAMSIRQPHRRAPPAILVGALAVFDAFNYPRGTLLRMGPGYFPTVLGLLMIGLGTILLVQASRPAPAPAERFSCCVRS